MLPVTFQANRTSFALCCFSPAPGSLPHLATPSFATGHRTATGNSSLQKHFLPAYCLNFAFCVQKAEFQQVQKPPCCTDAGAGICSAQRLPRRSQGMPVFPPSGMTYGNYGGVLTNIRKDRHASEIARLREQKVSLVFEEGPSVMELLLGGLIQQTGERNRHIITFIISFLSWFLTKLILITFP